MDNSDIETPFNAEDIIIKRDKNYKKVIRGSCCCLICVFLILFMNYVSFCLGIIYYQQDGSSSNRYIL